MCGSVDEPEAEKITRQNAEGGLDRAVVPGVGDSPTTPFVPRCTTRGSEVVDISTELSGSGDSPFRVIDRYLLQRHHEIEQLTDHRALGVRGDRVHHAVRAVIRADVVE